MTTLHIHPDSRALLEANGLADFDALFAAAADGRVDGHRWRSVSRLDLRPPPGGPAANAGTVTLYVKRMWGPGARPPIKDLLHLRWPMCPVHREWRNARALLRAGVPVSEPAAWGRSGTGGTRSLIAFRAVEGPSLARWLAEVGPGGTPAPTSAPAPALRRAVAEALGRAVRRLHDAGWSFPDLYAKHLFLENLEGPAPRVVLIDVQRLRRCLPWRAAEDLAALHVTTQAPSVTRADRLRFLRAYLGEGWSRGAARRLAERVGRRADEMPDRGRDPNLLAGRRAPDGAGGPPDGQLVMIDDDRLAVQEPFLPVLEAAGLASLDALMAYGGGDPYRVVPGRSTVRVELADPAGGRRAVYLKRYSRVPLRVRLRRMLSLNPPQSLARLEGRGLVRLRDLGLPTARILAFGEELTHGGRKERSCLVTEEIAGATPADEYAEAALAGPPSRAKTAARRALVRAIGRAARRFHAARLAHRDFYLCHFLVRPVAGGEPVVYLIDLQRLVAYRRSLPERRRVKDLAALLFSSWPSPATHVRSAVFSRTDAMRLAREYFGGSRLTAHEKRLVRRVVARARQVARREARRRARREGRP